MEEIKKSIQRSNDKKGNKPKFYRMNNIFGSLKLQLIYESNTNKNERFNKSKTNDELLKQPQQK